MIHISWFGLIYYSLCYLKVNHNTQWYTGIKHFKVQVNFLLLAPIKVLDFKLTKTQLTVLQDSRLKLANFEQFFAHRKSKYLSWRQS